MQQSKFKGVLLKKLTVGITLLFFSITSASEIQEKPFIIKHLYHHHFFNLTNASVYQQIGNYGALYNATDLFFTYGITPSDEVFFHGSVVLGNGIVYHTENLGYSVSPTGQDPQDFIENINDTGRKHILELWYHKTLNGFDFAAGLIDSTSFVDENDYANDQNLQFINSAFTNNPIAVLPSYNLGVYLKYSQGRNEYKLVIIDNDPDSGTVGIFQINHSGKNWNIRPYIYNVFGGESTDNGLGISADYSLKKTGYFLRIGIPFKNQNSFFSGGFERKTIFNKNDRLGFAVGVINKDKNTIISEIYYGKEITKHLSITGDLQYMKENQDNLILGGRVFLSY